MAPPAIIEAGEQFSGEPPLNLWTTIVAIVGGVILALPVMGAEAITVVRRAGVDGGTRLVRGQLTLLPKAIPSDLTVFYIQDETGGIAVRAATILNLTLRDTVEVEGPLELAGGVEPQIAAQRVEVVGRGSALAPRMVPLDEAFLGKHAGELVRVRGWVEKLAVGETRDTIYFQRGDDGLRAYLRRPADRPSVFPALAPVGAEVEASGLLVPMSNGGYQLRLREGADLAQLRGPWTLHPLKLAAGLGIAALICGAFILWNYTLRRSIQNQTAEIRMLLNRATESSKLKGEFLANLSHEIRTPIHGILGMQALLLESALTGPQREELRSAQDCTEHLLTLLNEVLDFSRMEAGQAVLEAAEFSPSRVLLGVARSFEAQGRLKGVQIRCDMQDVPELLVGDATRLRQILLNLTANAVKFTEEGHVHVRVESAGEADGRRRLMFSVSDTGIGIPRDKQALIFESFRQGDGSITRRYGGSGLGLAIASGLVELMGGRLEVESEVGQGSLFYFTAEFGKPATERIADRPVADDSDGAPRRPALKVLVAEDNVVNQRLVKRMLEKDGHEAVLVSTGVGAVAAAESEAFDVILMDVQMPEMDGLEATRAIRERECLERRERRPIYALTAHGLPGDLERFQAAGMDGTLTKPFLPQDLRNLLAIVIAVGGGVAPDGTGSPGERTAGEEAGQTGMAEGWR